MNADELMDVVRTMPEAEQERLFRMMEVNRSPVGKRHACEEKGRHYIDVINALLDTDVLARNRAAKRVQGRRFVVYKLYQDGYSEYQISAVVHRDHSTINHDKNTMRDMFAMPSMYKTEINIWNQFLQAI